MSCLNLKWGLIFAEDKESSLFTQLNSQYRAHRKQPSLYHGVKIRRTKTKRRLKHQNVQMNHILSPESLLSYNANHARRAKRNERRRYGLFAELLHGSPVEFYY